MTKYSRRQQTLLLALAMGLATVVLSYAFLPAEYASQIEVRIGPWFPGGMSMPNWVADYTAFLNVKAAEAARISGLSITSADLIDRSQIACQRRLRSFDDLRWQYWPPWELSTIDRLLHGSCVGVGSDAVLLITVKDKNPVRARALSQAWFDVLVNWRTRKNASIMPTYRVHVWATSRTVRNVSVDRASVSGGLATLLGFILGFVWPTARRTFSQAYAPAGGDPSATESHHDQRNL